jgi:toxin ParE1/3/4
MIIWSATAESDMLHLEEFLSARYAIAHKLISRILSAVETLEDFPLVGRKGRVSGTRELMISDTPYLVAYRLYDEDIQILAVLHGARRWPKNFNMPR